MKPVDSKLGEISAKAIEEIELKTWGITQQFLEVHQIIYENNKPIITKVDRDGLDETAIVYFPVEGEGFYFAVCVKIDPEVAVVGMYVEPYVSVCFSASSETIELNSLENMTTLKATRTWAKGEVKRIGSAVQHKVNQFIIESNPGPDEFEDKMEMLLDLLDTDERGVRELVENAGGYIQVAMEFHNGNTMLGGPGLSKEVIARLAALNLAVDFDLYVAGKPYR